MTTDTSGPLPSPLSATTTGALPFWYAYTASAAAAVIFTGVSLNAMPQNAGFYQQVYPAGGLLVQRLYMPPGWIAPRGDAEILEDCV